MKLEKISRMLFSTAFMLVADFFVYISFTNNYSVKNFTLSEFQKQYETGVYQFRFLSTKAILWLYDFLGTHGINYNALKFKFLDQHSDPRLYFAFMCYNVFFSLAAIIVFNLILNRKEIIATAAEKSLMIFFMVTVIALSQFVIVPYDLFAYFTSGLFLLILLAYLRSGEKIPLLILLCLTLFVATLNRESSAILLALSAVLLFSQGFTPKNIKALAALVISFCLAYFGLRLIFHSGITNDGFLLIQNFTDAKNLLALLLYGGLFYLQLRICNTQANLKKILLFHVFCLPYLIVCLLTGILYEVRLYVPIFLLGMILAKTGSAEEY